MRNSKTIRRLPPDTRKLARLLNEAERTVKRLNRLIDVIGSYERESIAMLERQKHYRERGTVDPLDFDWKESSMLSKVTNKKGG